jgi:hypothetical protein
MNLRQKLPLEQQFELAVFENQVQQLSQQEAQELLVRLREAMLFQNTTFREILKEAWGLDKEVDLTFKLLTDV